MRSLAILGGVYAVAMLATAALAHAVGSPFEIWFADTPILLGALLAGIVVLAVVWDGLMVSAGLLSQTLRRRVPWARRWPTVESLRGVRFFTCGPLPIPILLMTGFAILGTSNITLISLQLLGRATQWRDAFFWGLEAPVLLRLQHMVIDVAAWDRLYHSAWGIELVAAFALVLVARGPAIVLHYGVTMVVLFYLGRLLGILNPVMGPAFHQPAEFAYLDGSVTSAAMRVVAQVMAERPEVAMQHGGILLGGVSAMPSLHVAMVAATAYWMAVARRWTLLASVPWVLLVWTSTVALGWHYILDGAGGIALAVISAALVRALLKRMGIGELRPQPAPAAS